MIKSDPRSDFQNLSYKPNKFRIIDVQGKLHISPKESLIEDLSQELGDKFKNQISFACPAKYVKDGNGLDLIDYSFEHAMRFLKKFYFPVWDDIKENYVIKKKEKPVVNNVRGAPLNSFRLSAGKNLV